MNRLLSYLGLITKSRHEREMRELKAKAAQDIEPLMRENGQLKDALRLRTEQLDSAEADNELKDRVIGDLNEMIDYLRPDAQKWRDRAAPEAKRGQNRKAARQ